MVSSSKLYNKTYEHGEQSEDLNSGLQNSFGLAYFGEVVTHPVKVASSSYSTTTTGGLNGFAVYV